jgi:predicted RND superfamily exporter protein
VRSLARGPDKAEEIAERDPADVFKDLDDSPFWQRLLLARDRSATFVVLRLDGKDQKATIAAIDAVLARHERPGFDLGVSGVPYVSEHIRQRLERDLQRFSIAAFIAFGIVVAILFRSLAVLLGTMVASLSASFATFLVRAALGMRTDILAPNLWTIAFILTLSHVVYITAQWGQKAGRQGGREAVRDSVRAVGPAATWSLVANLLGFASLVFVTAEPLRRFGISGVIAALAAMACAFLLFPPFLRSAHPGSAPEGKFIPRLDAFFTTRHRVIASVTVAAAVLLAPFAFRVNTDPSLPSYFAEGDPMRTGLEGIDRSSGSSPLELVVTDAGGGHLDEDDTVNRLDDLQRNLERHKDVGTVLSPALLYAEADRPWYAFLFSWEKKLDQLEEPKHGRIARVFMSEDRKRARYILRMHESARTRARATVVSEIEGVARRHGFRVVRIAGLYPLQGELSRLVEGSVIRGLGGLLAAFFVIGLIVSRSLAAALAMTLCLAITPFTLFGLVGLAGMPLDIISAPAANVALPMGIDEMIHLAARFRRARQRAESVWAAWRQALSELWAPILASMLVVGSGFALFLLSSFPPTRRLGLLVCVGAIITDLVVLLVLPAVVAWRDRAATSKRLRAARALRVYR